VKDEIPQQTQESPRAMAALKRLGKAFFGRNAAPCTTRKAFSLTMLWTEVEMGGETYVSASGCGIVTTLNVCASSLGYARHKETGHTGLAWIGRKLRGTREGRSQSSATFRRIVQMQAIKILTSP